MSRTFRGADLIARTLTAAGVERLFTLSGNQIMPIFDACIDEEIDLIHTRHEAAAVHMADAVGRLTGEPGLALLTAGPGHANAVSAMYVAWAAESPLVVVSGHAPQSQLRRGAFQEMAQAELAGHVAKASWTVTDASQLGHDLARAIRLAKSGRPGPVHVSLPVDLLEATVDDSPQNLPQPDEFQPGMTLLDVDSASEILANLGKAERPLVLAGPAAMRCGQVQQGELQEALGIPVIGMESPRGVNDPSLGAFAEVLARADAVLLLGKKLDFTLRFGSEPTFDPACRIMHVDSATDVLEQTAAALAGSDRFQTAAMADTEPAAARLIDVAGNHERADKSWYDEVQSAIGFRPPEWQQASASEVDLLHPAAIGAAVNAFLAADDDAVLIADGGEFGQWAQACVSAPHRLINGPSGSIGSAIPFALGARTVHPDARIVTMLGDGTFGFHGMEFDTALRHGLPFIAVIGNDACWNAEKQIQLRNYGEDRQIGCELLPTRYDEVVKAMGGHGEFVSRADELPAALDRAFASGLPACVNVALEGQAAPVIRRS